MKVITFKVDELDYSAIQEAIAYHQTLVILPDGESDRAGSVLAEICRGWMELLGRRTDDFTR